MIAGIFHQGSGLGNQLHRYVATRILAMDKRYEFSMVAPENFKGKDFMNLDMGVQPCFHTYTTVPNSGKVIPYYGEPGRVPTTEWQEGTKYYNPEFHFIEDNTIIDGEFQDERYFGHRLKEVGEWLKVEPINVSDDMCVIGFRGGEFYLYPDLGLPKSYFDEGIVRMKKINPKMRFEIHTDDEVLAKQFFPGYKVIHDIGINWRSMRYAKYAIIANSSFYILPRLLNGGLTIAPRYWARRNIGEWSMPQNFYKCFTYL